MIQRRRCAGPAGPPPACRNEGRRRRCRATAATAAPAPAAAPLTTRRCQPREQRPQGQGWPIRPGDDEADRRRARRPRCRAAARRRRWRAGSRQARAAGSPRRCRPRTRSRLSQRRSPTQRRRSSAMWAGGPPNPVQPMRGHSRTMVATATRAGGACSGPVSIAARPRARQGRRGRVVADEEPTRVTESHLHRPLAVC